MTISIITPVYNAASFLDETIQSILAQTYTDWELLLVDDCSIDQSVAIAKKYIAQDDRIKLFQLEKNSGAGVARNKAIEQAKGRYIAFCDSDDQWKPHKLVTQLAFMKQHQCAFCYSSYEVISEEGHSIGQINAKKEVSYETMLKNDYIGCLTVIYDTKVVGKVFFPDIRKRQDWAMKLTILKKINKALGVTESLAIYRKRSNSLSANKFGLLKYNWIVYKKLENFSTLKSIYYIVQFLFYYTLKRLQS